MWKVKRHGLIMVEILLDNFGLTTCHEVLVGPDFGDLPSFFQNFIMKELKNRRSIVATLKNQMLCTAACLIYHMAPDHMNSAGFRTICSMTLVVRIIYDKN